METNKLLIFIVEDNLFYQQLIAKELEYVSYAIHFFVKGEDCIFALPVLRPDMIVLDNDLEGKLSGLETLKIVRVLNPDLYVIIFSARQKLDTDENISFYGHFEFVEKNEMTVGILKNKIFGSKIYLQKNQ